MKTVSLETFPFSRHPRRHVREEIFIPLSFGFNRARVQDGRIAGIPRVNF
jgi:hypothetical protein